MGRRYSSRKALQGQKHGHKPLAHEGQVERPGLCVVQITIQDVPRRSEDNSAYVILRVDAHRVQEIVQHGPIIPEHGGPGKVRRADCLMQDSICQGPGFLHRESVLEIASKVFDDRAFDIFAGGSMVYKDILFEDPSFD